MMNLFEKALSFHPLEEKHRNLIDIWFQKDHVKEFFYGEGLENTFRNINLFLKGIRNNGEYSFDFWIAYIGDEPFGFLMTTPVDGPYQFEDPINKWYEEGKKAITLDLLIGPEKFLGQGLGARMIQEFLLDKFRHVNKVLIDPETSNLRAVHVYEKAGFQKVEQFEQTHDSPLPCWMMHLEMDDLKNPN